MIDLQVTNRHHLHYLHEDLIYASLPVDELDRVLAASEQQQQQQDAGAGSSSAAATARPRAATAREWLETVNGNTRATADILGMLIQVCASRGGAEAHIALANMPLQMYQHPLQQASLQGF